MQKGSLVECKSFFILGNFPHHNVYIHDRGDPYDRLGYRTIVTLLYHFCIPVYILNSFSSGISSHRMDICKIVCEFEAILICMQMSDYTPLMISVR